MGMGQNINTFTINKKFDQIEYAVVYIKSLHFSLLLTCIVNSMLSLNGMQLINVIIAWKGNKTANKVLV